MCFQLVQFRQLRLEDCCMFFFFKQKTAYEMRISDWSSDVCSSDLRHGGGQVAQTLATAHHAGTVGQGEDARCGILDLDRNAAAPRLEIGRASCRERVCQYV